MILIADSGSTKTSWRWTTGAAETAGINPVRDNETDIEGIIQALPALTPDEIHFYGAGCIAPYADKVRRALARKFPSATLHVESDMLGAARALCGKHEGIACILGTGSNSCLYDGRNIVANVSPLGYILGDEGSGAVLGRTLVGDLLKDQLGEDLKQRFFEEFHLTPADIIDKVYRQPLPNRFLASLVPFLNRYKSEAKIHELLVNEFRRFLRRNVLLYRRPDLPLHFVGGIAGSFETEITEAVQCECLLMGRILQRPVDEIFAFHLSIDKKKHKSFENMLFNIGKTE